VPRSSCAATRSRASWSCSSTSSAESSSAWPARPQFGEAARTYTLLTVGDGLVTQIPALIVSTAAGLLVSKAGVSGAADKALMKQLSGYPQALGMSAGVMLVLATLPGIPMLPFLLLGWRRCGAGDFSPQEKACGFRGRSTRRGSSRRGSQCRGRRADFNGAEDRRSQDRTRLCVAAAGEWP